jgi:hypothetical protein
MKLHQFLKSNRRIKPFRTSLTSRNIRSTEYFVPSVEGKIPWAYTASSATVCNWRFRTQLRSRPPISRPQQRAAPFCSLSPRFTTQLRPLVEYRRARFIALFDLHQVMLCAFKALPLQVVRQMTSRTEWNPPKHSKIQFALH